MTARRVSMVAVVLGATVVLGWTAVAGTVLMLFAQDTASEAAPLPARCVVLAASSSGANDVQVTEEQLRNARTIVEVGQRRGVPPYGWTVALATSLQESGLRNLDYGDRDSLGLFQQRPSQGWGTPAQVQDPVYAADRFYAGLLDVGGWQRLAVTVAAQAVQRSAFPLAYAKHEPLAAALVRHLTGEEPGACRQVDTGDWQLPVTAYRLTSTFGPRTHPIRGTADFHTGLDFALPAGSAVRATAAGVVVSAGWGGGYGNLVVVRHAGGAETWYAHLASVDVTAGAQLSAGEQLGTVGSTGNSTGPHLHLEVRVNGSPVDPQPWLARKGSDPRA